MRQRVADFLSQRSECFAAAISFVPVIGKSLAERRQRMAERNARGNRFDERADSAGKTSALCIEAARVLSDSFEGLMLRMNAFYVAEFAGDLATGK